MVNNRKSMAYNKTKRTAEHAMGRFLGFGTKECPWHASKDRLELVAEFLRQAKVPVEWENNTIVNDYKGLKIAQGLSCIGHRGQWTFGQLDLDEEYRQLFVDLIVVGSKYLKKTMTAEEMDLAQVELTNALTRGEIKLPVYFNTSTTHHLRHLMKKVNACGC